MAYDLGILGGGQLGRMTVQAAQRMGLTCLSMDPNPRCSAGGVGPVLNAPLEDSDAIAQMFAQCARVTVENEFIDARRIREGMERAGATPGRFMPGLECLETIQDKLAQRETLAKAGVPGPKATGIDDDGATAVAQIGFPMVLKARFGGFDGRGTRFVNDAQDFEDNSSVWRGGAWMAERRVNFRRELATLVCRFPQREGHFAFCFPTMETVQVNGQCDLVFPAAADASEIAIAAVEALGGEGLFGVELFETEDGELLVNEIAPRPHNSGHYTLDWGGLSQFEAHARLALGLPVVPDEGGPTCMANLIGQEGAQDWRPGLAAAIAEDPSVHVHWYGKHPVRPGRKMGHINAVGARVVERATIARQRFYEAWSGNPPARSAILD